VIAGLLGLTILGAVTAYVFSASKSSDVTARMGPKKNYATLPDMSFTLGGAAGRNVDIHVLLEIDPGVDGQIVQPYAPRIADQLSERLREIHPGQLSGAEGAKLMKEAIAAAVGSEVRQLRVRDVLLDRMVIR
jgi:flagellar basal body-associated protein FliL